MRPKRWQKPALARIPHRRPQKQQKKHTHTHANFIIPRNYLRLDAGLEIERVLFYRHHTPRSNMKVQGKKNLREQQVVYRSARRRNLKTISLNECWVVFTMWAADATELRHTYFSFTHTHHIATDEIESRSSRWNNYDVFIFDSLLWRWQESLG